MKKISQAKINWIFQTIALVVLINAPHWILRDRLALTPAIFSLDAFLVLFILNKHRVIGAFLILLTWLVDIIAASAKLYLFNTPAEFIKSFSFAGELDFLKFITLEMATVIVFILIVWMTMLIIQRRHTEPLKGAVVIITLLLTCFASDVLNGSSIGSRNGERIFAENIAGSSFFAVARFFYDITSQSKDSLIDISYDVDESEKAVKSLIHMSRKDGVLYLIIESMGEHKNKTVMEWYKSKFATAEIISDYSVDAAIVKSRGGTTYGELRRLCAYSGSYWLITNEQSSNCIPKQLADKGWTTVGLHGFSGLMFDRFNWWPIIGISDARFSEQLKVRHIDRCGGAFRGICDADLISDAVEAATPNSFVYALTLNSHLPIAPIVIPSDLLELCMKENLTDEICGLMATIGHGVDTLIAAMSSSKNRPLIVMVGDHPPPFYTALSREQFTPNAVPMFVLTPK